MQNRPQPRRRVLLHRRQRVGVGRQRHLDPLVPEPLLHDVRRDPGLEQEWSRRCGASRGT